MKKALITLIAVLLVMNSVHANPRPTYNPIVEYLPVIVGVFTLGLGFLIYRSLSGKYKVEFTEEEINISVNEEGSVTVEGNYKFKRSGKGIKNYKIVYPFPTRKKFGEVQILEVSINGRTAEYHTFEVKRSNQISLNLHFDESDICNFKIKFIQNPINNEYKYILKTTKRWKKPLESTVINLNLAENIKLENSYYPLIQIKKDNAFSTFQFKEKEFYPYEDFDFSWIYE
jgi:hypothetical protein